MLPGMLHTIRTWLARKLAPPPVSAPVVAKLPPRVNWRKMLELLRGSSPETKGRQPGEYRWPELPEGVLPTNKAALALDNVLPGEVRRTDVAMDSAFAGIPNIFGFLGGNGYGAGLWFPGYPYLAELTQISEYRAPSETTSTEMTRKWFDLQSKEGGDKSKQISEIRAACDEFKVRDLFRRAAKLDGEFGRAQIYINIDDANEQVRQLPLEITPEGIAKGSLKSIQCIEPYWSTPYSWNAMYPERADFYKPTSWYIMGRKTHATRLLTFIGREVPDLLKPAYNFGGISLTQLMEPYVNAWLRTRKSVNDLISNFSIPVLYTDLAATLTEGGEPGSGLLARLQAFTLTRNNQAVAAINKDTELLEFAEATLASLDKLQAQSQEHMAAPAHVPLIKLFGVVPTGLNATGEGEIQVWYDWINASQVNLFEPNLYKLLKIIQLHLYGKIDDDLIINWISLDEPTPKELSDIRKSDADAGAVYIQNSVITNDEERKRLQSNPESGYTNLVGNAPLPEPDPEPTTDPDNDAQREHEASEADKDREHETGKAVLATAAKPAPAVPIKAKTSG